MTAKIDIVNDGDDELLHDFLDGKNDVPAVGKTRKANSHDDDEDEDDDCIMID